MWRWLLIALLLALINNHSAADDRLYLLFLNVMTTEGEFARFPIKPTEQGVSLVECKKQLEQWKSTISETDAVVMLKLMEQGKSAKLEASCELK